MKGQSPWRAAPIEASLELMGVYAAEQSASEFDAIAHQTPTAKEETRKMRERGLKQTLAERDGSFAKL